LTPDYWPRAIAELADRDRVLARLIAHYSDLQLRSRGDAFGTLTRSIVGQQISIKAADTVWGRLAEALPAIDPAAVLAADPQRLRACGLSARKVEYLADLARHFADGRLGGGSWDEDDEAVIAALTAVKGIGRWTAEMFLIFYLLRPDVLPLDDIGLQRAMRLHYNGDVPLARLKMRKIADAWSPWRSVATWYLWRSLDPVPVEY